MGSSGKDQKNVSWSASSLCKISFLCCLQLLGAKMGENRFYCADVGFFNLNSLSYSSAEQLQLAEPTELLLLDSFTFMVGCLGRKKKATHPLLHLCQMALMAGSWWPPIAASLLGGTAGCWQCRGPVPASRNRRRCHHAFLTVAASSRGILESCSIPPLHAAPPNRPLPSDEPCLWG